MVYKRAVGGFFESSPISQNLKTEIYKSRRTTGISKRIIGVSKLKERQRAHQNIILDIFFHFSKYDVDITPPPSPEHVRIKITPK